MSAPVQPPAPAIAELEDACTCWVCFETFVDPVSLFCGHTFCKDCVIKVYKKNPTCPFCRHAFGLPLPPINQSIVRLVNQLRALKQPAGAEASVPTGERARQTSPFFELPDAVMREVLFRCGPAGMARLARTCKQLRDATADQLVWRDLCRARWPFVSIDRHHNWRGCYRAHNGIQRGWEGGKAGDFKVATFRGHTDYITASQLYRATLVTASADRSVRMWRSDSEEAVRVITGHEAAVTCLQFSEAQIVSGSDDATARVWDTQTGLPLHLLRHTSRVTSLRFNDAVAAIGCGNGQVKLWELKTGAPIRTVTGHTAPIIGTWFDDRDLFTCAVDGVRVYDIGTGACRTTIPTPATAFQVNLHEVVTGGADGMVRVWNSVNGSCVGQMEHTRWQAINAVACDGRRIVSACADGTAAVWDYASRARVHTLADHKGAVHSVQFDDNKIVTASADNSIKVWNAATGARMYTLLGGSLQRRANNPPHPTRPGITEAAFDESRIVAAINSLVRVYNFDVTEEPEQMQV